MCEKVFLFRSRVCKVSAGTTDSTSVTDVKSSNGVPLAVPTYQRDEATLLRGFQDTAQRWHQESTLCPLLLRATSCTSIFGLCVDPSSPPIRAGCVVTYQTNNKRVLPLFSPPPSRKGCETSNQILGRPSCGIAVQLTISYTPDSIPPVAPPTLLRTPP